MIVILIGIAGSGKTTVGQCLAAHLGWRFVEGDDFHSPANVAKMSQGVPLEERDRWPWLRALRAQIVALQQQGKSAIITCSVLKQRYRDVLRPDGDEAIQFVYLKGEAAMLRSRLQQRQDHFMQAEMLDSQLAILEEPEDAIAVDIGNNQTPKQIVAAIIARLDLPTRPNSES